MDKCPNKILSTGHTCLTYSCYTNELNLFIKLMQNPKTDPNKCDLFGLTPLYYCATHGDKQIYFINKLLIKGADPNLNNNDKTVLDAAIESMSLNGIKFLISKGFNLKLPNINNIPKSNLDYLLIENILDFQKLTTKQFSSFLIRNPGQAHCYYQIINKNHLYHIIKSSHCLTKLFIKIYSCTDEHPFKILKSLMSVYLPNPNLIKLMLNKIKYLTQNMITEMSEAMTGFLNDTTVKNLVEASFDPEKIKLENISYSGWLFLNNIKKLVKPDLIKILTTNVDAKQIFDLIIDEYPQWLSTVEVKPTYYIYVNKIWQIRLLEKMVFNTEHIAKCINYNNLDINSITWITNSYLNNPEAFKINPLLSAIRFESVSAVEFMINSGISVHITDFVSKKTLLHYASFYPPDAGIYLTGLLINHNIDINAKDTHGNTALYYLAKEFCYRINDPKIYWIKRMLSYHPDFDLKTVLMIAKTNSKLLKLFVKEYPDEIKSNAEEIAIQLVNSPLITLNALRSLLWIKPTLDVQLLLEEIIINKKLYFNLVEINKYNKYNLIVDDLGEGDECIELLLSKGAIFSLTMICDYLSIRVEDNVKEYVNVNSQYILRAHYLVQKVQINNLYYLISSLLQIGTIPYLYNLIAVRILFQGEKFFKDLFDGEDLLNACRLGFIKIVSDLIKNFHLDINYINLSGYTPLHFALYLPNSDILEYLLNLDDIKPTKEALIYYLKQQKENCNLLHIEIMLKCSKFNYLEKDEKNRNILDYLQFANLLDIFIDLINVEKLPMVYFRTGNSKEFQPCGEKKTDQDCLICFQKIKDTKWIKCQHNHHFHLECLFKWFSNIESKAICPNCCQKFDNPVAYIG